MKAVALFRRLPFQLRWLQLPGLVLILITYGYDPYGIFLLAGVFLTVLSLGFALCLQVTARQLRKLGESVLVKIGCPLCGEMIEAGDSPDTFISHMESHGATVVGFTITGEPQPQPTSQQTPAKQWTEDDL